MLLLAMKCLLAHLLGDFILQPDKWIKDKFENKHRSKYLFYHVAVHAVVLLVLLGFALEYWLGWLLIVISHYLIDVTKVTLDGRFKKLDSTRLFILDQLAHLLMIAIVVCYYFPATFTFSDALELKILTVISGLITVVFVCPVFMHMVMKRWEKDIEEPQADSLKDAGKIIGILERIFVFAFIMLNQWQSIGLLIAAKSVFRFNDLSRATDRKLTEYFLIGTLISFALAIVVGLICRQIIS